MLEFIVAWHSWLAIIPVTIAGAVCGEIVSRMLRPFALSAGKNVIITVAIAAPVVIGTLYGLNTLAASYFQEECCRKRVTAWLTQSTPYATLIEHHPEAKSALIAAGLKMRLGGQDAIVGKAEFSAVLNHYLRHYLPVTSDIAAREFVMAATALVDEALKTEPEICVEFLNGRSQDLEHFPFSLVRILSL